MDFNQVRYFVALADTLNFTRASERCFVSQSALTQAIKRLESELGGDLISRDGRNTELTELGKSIRGHFEHIAQTRDLVKSTAKTVLSGEMAELNIGIMCTIGPRILANLMETFQLEHPSITLILHDVSGELVPNMLMSGALDGVFCARHSQRHPKLDYIELFEENMVVAFPEGHAFSQVDVVSLKDVAQQRYLDRLHCEFRSEYLDFCKANNLEFRAVFSSEREDWIQSMVKDGMGVSLMPQYSVLHPGLHHRAIKDPSLQRTVEFAYMANGDISPAMNLLLEDSRNFDWKEQTSSIFA